MKFVDWINKIWKHPRDIDGPPYKTPGDFGIRSLLHVPVGIICALMVLAHPVLPIVFAYWFYKYQRNEDAHTEDQAWKDLNGALIGFFIGAVIVFLIG